MVSYMPNMVNGPWAFSQSVPDFIDDNSEQQTQLSTTSFVQHRQQPTSSFAQPLISQQQQQTYVRVSMIPHQQTSYPFGTDILSPQMDNTIRSITPPPMSLATDNYNNNNRSNMGMSSSSMDQLVDEVRMLLQSSQALLEPARQQPIEYVLSRSVSPLEGYSNTVNVSTPTLSQPPSGYYYTHRQPAVYSAPATPALCTSPMLIKTPSTTPVVHQQQKQVDNYAVTRAWTMPPTTEEEDEQLAWESPKLSAHLYNSSNINNVRSLTRQTAVSQPPQQNSNNRTGDKVCSNCGTHSSSVWRFSKLANADANIVTSSLSVDSTASSPSTPKLLLCNACGLYEKRTGIKRPAGLKTHTISTATAVGLNNNKQKSPVHKTSSMTVRMDSLPYTPSIKEHVPSQYVYNMINNNNDIHNSQREFAALRSVSEPVLPIQGH